MPDKAIVFPTIADVLYYDGAILSDYSSTEDQTLTELSGLLLSALTSSTLSGISSLLPLSDYTTSTLWDLMGDVTSPWLVEDGLTINHAIEERSTCEFSVVDPTRSYDFQPGQEVILTVAEYDDSFEIIFGGVILNVEIIKSKSLAWIWHLTCTDYHYIADSRVVSAAYTGLTAGEIVTDILSDVLEDEGITVGEIQNGASLEDISFNYVSVAEAFDKLAELAGFTWWIDQYKRLYFVSRTSYSSAWNVTNSSEIENLTYELGNPNYRNVQYVCGGDALTASRTESFIGDGVRRTFPLGYPLAKEPTVTVGGSSQTVGIGGVEFDKQWYWNEGNNTITQDDDETPISGAGQTLAVTYIGSYKLMTKVSQSAEVTNWKDLCGYGTGQIEKVHTDSTIINKDAAVETAQSKLLNYASIGSKVSYDTREYGLAVGVVQNINVPLAGIDDDDFLITSIDFKFDSYGPRCTINAVSGPIEESWEKIFCDIAQSAMREQEAVAGSESTVQGLETFSTTWLATTHPNPFIDVYPDDGILPGDIDFPCLADEDINTWLVLYSGGVEFFRKLVASVTITATQIDTIAVVLANEANGVSIDAVGLYGGNLATSTLGSGIELTKYSYSKTKNALESLQFEFSDLRWA